MVQSIDEAFFTGLGNLAGQIAPTDAPSPISGVEKNDLIRGAIDASRFISPTASPTTGPMADMIVNAQQTNFPVDQNKMRISNTQTGGSTGTTFDAIYDNLAQSTKDLFDNVTSTDFTSQIEELAEQGRVDIEDMSQEQLQFLQDAFDRRMTQISDIGNELSSSLRALDITGQREIDAIAADASKRQREAAQRQTAERGEAREALGEQVSSEFEEVAALTSGLLASTDESNAAAMDRLRTVSRMASQERLAMPAKLVAQSQMAVGDEKFQLENQIRMATNDALRQLNAQERQQVLDEARRLAQQGYAQDMALAQSLQKIEAARASMYIQEEKERRARAAAAAAAAQKQKQTALDNANAAAILGISPEEYRLMDPKARAKLWENAYSTPTQEEMITQGQMQVEATKYGFTLDEWMLTPENDKKIIRDEFQNTVTAAGQPAPNSLEAISETHGEDIAGFVMEAVSKKNAIADATSLHGEGSDKEKQAQEDYANYIAQFSTGGGDRGGGYTRTGERILNAVATQDVLAPYVPTVNSMSAGQNPYGRVSQGGSRDSYITDGYTQLPTFTANTPISDFFRLLYDGSFSQ